MDGELIYDVAGNRTQVDWKVLNPFIEVSPGSHWLHGRVNGHTGVPYP